MRVSLVCPETKAGKKIFLLEIEISHSATNLKKKSSRDEGNTIQKQKALVMTSKPDLFP